MLSSRTLRRANLRRNPAVVKATAGVVAGMVGMSTAAYGLLHVIQPYKGNGARSAEQASDGGSGSGDLIASIIDLVPAELGVNEIPGSDSLYSLSSAGEFVLSIVGGVQPPATGTVTPPSGGDSGGGPDGGGGSGGGLLPWNGGSVTPPPGGGSSDGSGWNIPNVSITPPTVVTPGLGGVDPYCSEPAPPPGLAADLSGPSSAPSETDDGTATAEQADGDSTGNESTCTAQSITLA